MTDEQIKVIEQTIVHIYQNVKDMDKQKQALEKLIGKEYLGNGTWCPPSCSVQEQTRIY